MSSNHIFIYYTMHGHVLSKIFCVELIFSIEYSTINKSPIMLFYGICGLARPKI
jgi:hypothetical protein